MAANYAPVRSVQRAIRILNVLNGFGESGLTQLAKRSSVPKATALRIIETLASERLVERNAETGKYRVSSGVQKLSAGYVGNSVIDEAVSRVQLLTRTFRWPGSIALPEGTGMRLLFGTHRNNPLSLWSEEVREFMPMQQFAIGHAYLAHCAPDACEAHLNLIDASLEEDGLPPLDRSVLKFTLGQVRSAGYAYRPASRKNHTCTLAVPILAKGVAIGAMGVTYFHNALGRGEAQRLFLPMLQAPLIVDRHVEVPTQSG